MCYGENGLLDWILIGTSSNSVFDDLRNIVEESDAIRFWNEDGVFNLCSGNRIIC